LLSTVGVGRKIATVVAVDGHRNGSAWRLAGHLHRILQNVQAKWSGLSHEQRHTGSSKRLDH